MNNDYEKLAELIIGVMGDALDYSVEQNQKKIDNLSKQMTTSERRQTERLWNFRLAEAQQEMIENYPSPIQGSSSSGEFLARQWRLEGIIIRSLAKKKSQKER